MKQNQSIGFAIFSGFIMLIINPLAFVLMVWVYTANVPIYSHVWETLLGAPLMGVIVGIVSLVWYFSRHRRELK